LDIVAIFWLPAVELNVFDMCDHLAVLPVVMPRDMQRHSGSPFQIIYRRHQKVFSIGLGCSLLKNAMNGRVSNREEFQSNTELAIK
jgi:hypothetical protein